MLILFSKWGYEGLLPITQCHFALILSPIVFKPLPIRKFVYDIRKLLLLVALCFI